MAASSATWCASRAPGRWCEWGWRAVWLAQQERLPLAEWGEAGEVYASHVEQGAARLAFDGPLDVPVLRDELACDVEDARAGRGGLLLTEGAR